VYSLILVLAQGITTVGTYNDLNLCQAQLAQFRQQEIKAACVQQPTPEQSMAQAQRMMQSFLKLMESQPKE
jgi:hypothetical protein